MKLTNILVVVDKRMRSTTALERGVTLARKYGAQLHLCIFDSDPLIEHAVTLLEPEALKLLRTEYLAERQTWLATQAAAWAEHGVRIKYDVIWAPKPHEEILKKVREIGPDLLIKDIHSEPMQQRLSHSPLDRQVLRYCPVPVMLVGPSAKYRPRRIVVAVDTKMTSFRPGPLNDEMFSAAELISQSFDAELHAAHVTMPFSPFEVASMSLADIYAKFLFAESQAFRDICLSHDVAHDNQHLLNGNTAIEIARLTQRMDIDVLILGSNDCTAENRFMLGSTVESLLGQVDCEILIIKNPDTASIQKVSGDHEVIRSDVKPEVV